MITKINDDLKLLFAMMKNEDIKLLTANIALHRRDDIEKLFFELENIVERELVLNKQQLSLIKDSKVFIFEDTYQAIPETGGLSCCTISVKLNNMKIQFGSCLPIKT